VARPRTIKAGRARSFHEGPGKSGKPRGVFQRGINQRALHRFVLFFREKLLRIRGIDFSLAAQGPLSQSPSRSVCTHSFSLWNHVRRQRKNQRDGDAAQPESGKPRRIPATECFSSTLHGSDQLIHRRRERETRRAGDRPKELPRAVLPCRAFCS